MMNFSLLYSTFKIQHLSFLLSQYHHPVRIQPDENKEQYGEREQGRAAIAEEGQGNADDRRQPDGHADVDHEMEKDDGRQPVAIDARVHRALPLGSKEDAQEQRHVKRDDERRAHESPVLANGAEDEVGALLGNKIIFGLRALQESFAEKPARADGDFTLVHVVAHAFEVGLLAEENINARALVRLQHAVIDIVNAHDHARCDDEHGSNENDAAFVFAREEKDEQGDACEDADEDKFVYEQGKDEEYDGKKTEQEEIAGQPFAVEEEDERHEDESGAGVVLRQRERQRNGDDDARHYFGAHVFHAYVERGEIFRQRHARGELGELGGLQLERTDVNPCFGTFHLACNDE